MKKVIHFPKHKMKRDPNSVGDIVTERKHSDFELRLIFCSTVKTAESNILLMHSKGDGRGIGLEYQVLDKTS